MAGYNPRCSKCLKCMTCRGDGTVRTTKSGRKPNGDWAHRYEQETCRSCGGRGGKPCGGHR